MASRPTVSVAEDLPAWVRRNWTVPLVIGLLLTVFGVILLVNVDAGVETLRWLVVIALVLAAVQAFATTSPRHRPWAGRLAGALYVLGALVAMFWPGVTLRALALTLGLALVVGGAFQAGSSWRRKGVVRRWAVGFTTGLLAVIAGLVFLFGNPMISVVVLVVVLGCYLVFGGVALLMLSLVIRRLAASAGR